MRILGLDPGLGTTGWGLIQAEGNRLSHLANGEVKTAQPEPLDVGVGWRPEHRAPALAHEQPIGIV